MKALELNSEEKQMRDINRRLRDLCSRRSESQAAIAAAAGISPQRLNDIVQGRKPLSLKLVVPICRAVGCEPNDLFGWENGGNGFLSGRITKLTVLDLITGEEVAAVTNDLITTAGDDIVVRITPAYD